METLEWVSAVWCAGLAAWGGGWLFLSSRRDVRRAKLAGQLAVRYVQEREVSSGRHRRAEDEPATWPIVAQQPQRFYGNAATIPIPRQQGTELAADTYRPRHALAEPVWPVVDLDRLTAERTTMEFEPCRSM
jgi:hypothetical protein